MVVELSDDAAGLIDGALQTVVEHFRNHERVRLVTHFEHVVLVHHSKARMCSYLYVIFWRKKVLALLCLTERTKNW